MIKVYNANDDKVTMEGRYPNDLNDSHLIARIVRIEVETKVVVTEFPLEEKLIKKP